MDLDAYVQRHQHEWDDLARLVDKRRLSGDEADRLIDGYGRVATHLSRIRTSAPDPPVIAHLSTLLASARTRAGVGRASLWQEVGRFVTTTFPAQLYRIRWWWIGVTIACVVVAYAAGAWFVANPVAESGLISARDAQAIVDTEFVDYYFEHPMASFATRVWVNNLWVAALCLAFGALGFPVIYLLWQNIANLAVMGSLMHAAGQAGVFYGYLLPHGLLELTAVFVAGGAGLRMFWSWIAPGERTRGQALAREGRSAAGVALGLVLVLGVSGLIEGFVTPSPLPAWARVSIGAIALLAFLWYALVLGRRAFRAGADGDVAPVDREATDPVAA